MRIPIRLFVVAFLTAIDQTSKYWVENSLVFQQSQPFIPFLSFYRTYNKGIAFSGLSFLSSNVLIALIVVVMGFVLWLWSQLEGKRIISHFGFAFIMAGATGNLIDRIVQGHVIDFIQVHTANWSFAIFNLADSMITTGAVLIIIDEIVQIFEARKEKISE